MEGNLGIPRKVRIMARIRRGKEPNSNGVRDSKPAFDAEPAVGSEHERLLGLVDELIERDKEILAALAK